MLLAQDLLTPSPTERQLSAKALLALISLLLAMAVWFSGLQNSLSRESVTPALALQQQEKALLAEPALPAQLRPLLTGGDASAQLLEALLEVPLDRLDERQRLLLASLTGDEGQRQAALSEPFQTPVFSSFQDVLARHRPGAGLRDADAALLEAPEFDPLLRMLGCKALGGRGDQCSDDRDAEAAAAASQRLVLAQLLPISSLMVGVLLLLRHLWMKVRSRLASWPPVMGPLLTPADMAILVAGGFVLLGEVLLPVLVGPLFALIAKGQSASLAQAVVVLLGYVTLAVPPLAILRLQLDGLSEVEVPTGGWLQWRIQPVFRALLQGMRGWLMVMPPVVLTGWLMGLVLGDQGGSNPLLEMVLRSSNPLALLLLALTAVVLAPLFEELVFRGVLLPVLSRWLGSGWGVVLSGLVFAVAHLSLGELPPLFVLGIGLAMLRLSSGRLLPCVVMHACWNAATFLNLVLLGS